MTDACENITFPHLLLRMVTSNHSGLWQSCSCRYCHSRQQEQKKKHSMRMHIAHLETVCVSVSVTSSRCWSRGSPNEQNWTGLQLSPPDVTSRERSPGLMSGGGRRREYPNLPFPGEVPKSDVQCPRGYPTMWPIPWYIWCSPPKQTTNASARN